MDESTLNEVLRDANRRQFWIVLWGDPEHSTDDDVQIFDEPEYDQGLATRNHRRWRYPICPSHTFSKIIFVGEVIAAPRRSSTQESEKEEWRKRWTWSVPVRNLTPIYGRHWRECAERTFQLEDQYNAMHPQHAVSIGRVHGLHVRFPEAFAKFLLKEIINIR